MNQKIAAPIIRRVLKSASGRKLLSSPWIYDGRAFICDGYRAYDLARLPEGIEIDPDIARDQEARNKDMMDICKRAFIYFDDPDSNAHAIPAPALADVKGVKAAFKENGIKTALIKVDKAYYNIDYVHDIKRLLPGAAWYIATADNGVKWLFAIADEGRASLLPVRPKDNAAGLADELAAAPAPDHSCEPAPAAADEPAPDTSEAPAPAADEPAPDTSEAAAPAADEPAPDHSCEPAPAADEPAAPAPIPAHIAAKIAKIKKEEDTPHMFSFTNTSISINGATFPAEYSKSPYGSMHVIARVPGGPVTINFTPDHPDYRAAILAYNGDAPDTSEAADELAAPALDHSCEAAPAADEPAPDTSEAAAPAPDAIQGNGWYIKFDAVAARTRVIFAAAPVPAAADALADAGFYYSKAMRSYNKKLTNKARRAAQALALKLNAIYA